MDDHPNVQRLIESVAAFNDRNMDRMLSGWTENPIFHVPVRGPRGGDYKGRDELRQLNEAVWSLSGDTFKLEVIDAVADNHHGVALMRLVAARDDLTADFTLAYAVKFDSEGRQAEAWYLPNDRAAYEALLA